MDLAARAGYDPRAGVTLWQKMSTANKGAPPQWLSTHPSGKNRIAEISKHLPKVLPLYAKTRNITAAQLPAYQTNWATLAPIKQRMRILTGFWNLKNETNIVNFQFNSKFLRLKNVLLIDE